MVQVRRGYPARPCKTPEMSDWQPIYRFSETATQVQPYKGVSGSREVRGTGGVLPTGPRRPWGAFWRTAVVLARSRWWWRNPHRPEPDALAGCCCGLRVLYRAFDVYGSRPAIQSRMTGRARVVVTY
jgi:hypothetical protein